MLQIGKAKDLPALLRAPSSEPYRIYLSQINVTDVTRTLCSFVFVQQKAILGGDMMRTNFNFCLKNKGYNGLIWTKIQFVSSFLMT
jgi:hypothetical protein